MLAESLALSAVLFTIGAIGVLTRRNAIIIFMCVELMLNAVNLTSTLRRTRRPTAPMVKSMADRKSVV